MIEIGQMKFVFAAILACCSGLVPAAAQDRSEIPSENSSAIDVSFVGHYYLSGVMETGSEMLLNADGSYEWVLTVGAMDMYSKGRWRRIGQHIILFAKQEDQSEPLFTLGARQPWNEAAEENAQEDAMRERNNARVEKCHFLRARDGHAYVDSAMTPPYRDVTPELVAEADNAALTEADTRHAYELAAFAAMASDPVDDILHDKAKDAGLAWRRARDHWRQAQSDAKKPFIRLDEPQLPEQCVLENWPIRPTDIAKESWIGGFAVQVRDPDRGAYFNSVDIRFGLESGASLSRTTESGGIAWIPRNPSDRVNSITIVEQTGLTPKEHRFPISPINDGFIEIAYNSDAHAQPAFAELRLDIDGRDLRGFNGRGTYSRPNR